MQNKKAMASSDAETDSTGDWSGRVVAYRDFAMDLAARRGSAGEPDTPRNAGNRRTASKKALLKALENLGATW
jgi:hypothetical protein